ncbi:hypothetical protein [Parasitella parasitica]|uniref:Uncharacterized protein n=1 Tax=Parasitella parasitica TaxID=35722 RepID=A0A0B7NXM2_9FUNG|nr:hypothetical protein [Parasitella parasitica]
MALKETSFVPITVLKGGEQLSFACSKRLEATLRKNLDFGLVLFSIAFLLLISLVYTFLPDASTVFTSQDLRNPISFSTIYAGRAKSKEIQECLSIKANHPNVVVWDGQGQVPQNFYIYIGNEIIRRIEKDVHIMTTNDHKGIDSWPRPTSSADVNEMPNPVTSYVRVFDGFNPSVKAIRIVASGGITSVLALPGSANVIGGEAYACNLRPWSTVSNQDMLIQANNTEYKEWRRMKKACGENPKPYIRLGMAYLSRNELTKAQNLKREDFDAYCIPEVLRHAPNNITIVTFANWRYTKETYQSISEELKILCEAGLGHCIEYLKLDYDANIVIWDREPLALAAVPFHVIIDGVPLFDEPRCDKKSNVPGYDLQGSYVLTGFVGVGSSLDLIEMLFEPMASDRNAAAVKNDNPKDLLRAVDALMSRNVVVGVSAAFKTNAEFRKKACAT